MLKINSYDEYFKLLENTCNYEDYLNYQRILATLYNRDKSSLVSFQHINKQINDYLNFEVIDWVAESTNESSKLKSLIDSWDNLIDDILIINQLIVLTQQYGSKISHETLKLTHLIFQSMPFQEVTQRKNDLLSRLKNELAGESINFNKITNTVTLNNNINFEQEAKLKAQEEAKFKAQEEAKFKAQEEAKLKAQEEAKLKAQEEAELKAQEEAELKAQEEAKLKAQEEAKFKAQEEAKFKAQEEAKLKAQEEAELKAQEEAESKADKVRSELEINNGIERLYCRLCDKQYSTKYPICLKCGGQLETIYVKV